MTNLFKRPKELYTGEACERFINEYIEMGGEATQIDEGGCGIGTWILANCGCNLYEFVIEEVYLNEWSSGHSLKKYRHGLPKKWIKALDDYENRQMEDGQNENGVYKI